MATNLEPKIDMDNLNKPRILIGVSGSLDSTLLPNYLRVIKDNLDCTVTVMMTPNATNFIKPEAIALFVERVVCGERPQDWTTDKPGRLAAEHDIMLVLPTTANTLAAIANGFSGNRLTTVVLAATFPVLLFPVMGAPMWDKPAVRRNVAQARADGYEIVEPVWCEHFDPLLGRMHGHHSLPSPEQVLALLQERLDGAARPQRLALTGTHP